MRKANYQLKICDISGPFTKQTPFRISRSMLKETQIKLLSLHQNSFYGPNVVIKFFLNFTQSHKTPQILHGQTRK